MKILTAWLRTYLPSLPVSDRQLADDLTLRGIAVEGVHDLGEGNGHLFEMDITTNRVDAMNHFGIAREAATVYNLPLPPLDPALPASTPAAAFPVHIEAPHLCGRFTARVLRDVTIGPSTGEIARLFTLLGQKAISNAVDASNFTLLGMGHPTHAFDLDKIEGAIVVRLARAGEKLRLLDGSERTLTADDLVIADDRKALSLAGVMGGWDSMITPSTKNILVEAAWFDPATIRASSRRHLLHTDASHRFERGADLNAAGLANDLVSGLILQSGGRLEGDLIDIIDPAAEQRTSRRAPVSLSVGQVQRHLGATLDDTPGHSALTSDLVQQYLTALGCTLTTATSAGSTRGTLHTLQDYPGNAAFSVNLPSWRLDLEREIDLIEEIARVFGYNRFANTLPAARPVVEHPSTPAIRAVRDRLLALGYTETISSTFASVPESDLFLATAAAGGKGSSIPMENPLSEEASNLRPSLLPGMLSLLALNLNRDVSEVRAFEQGHVFRSFDSSINHVSTVTELPSLSLGLTSAAAHPSSLHAQDEAPVFELKGTIESLASLFTLTGGAEALTFVTGSAPPWLHPGRSATALLNGSPLAHFGQLAASEQARRKLRQPVYLAEIELASLLELPLRRRTAHDLSRFQAVERDFSFLFPDTVQWHTIAAAVHALAFPELQRLAPVEIFRDPKGRAVPAGRHSLLIRTVFQSADRTLTDDELTGWSREIVAALTQIGGTQRA